MAVDKNKVTAEATKLIQKGQFDKAIRAYEKILAEDPKDVRFLLKIGELQQKKGDPRSAAETFGRVADAYGEQGFFLKAVAVYKQVLKLAPDDVRVNERLAALYQQLGLLSEAMAQMQLIAAGAERAGDEAKLLDVLRRMVELDPDNVVSAIKLGELYARQSKTAQAVEHLRRAADLLKRSGRTDEYVKVAERIAFLAPDDHRLSRDIAEMLLARGDTKRALAKLQACFKADPKDVPTLHLLAQAFEDLGQTSKMVSVHRELAHVHGEQGRAEEARAAWRRVLELAPDDAEATEALGAPRAAPPPPPRAPTPEPAAPAAPATVVQAAAPATVASPPAPPRAAPAVVIPPPPPATAPARAASPAAEGPVGPDAIPKLLTETDVYVKYGLHQKALEHLDRVFAVDPDHLEGREKALRLRTLRNDAEGAAGEAVRVARIALGRGLVDRARAAAESLAAIAPGHPALAEIAAALEPAGAVPGAVGDVVASEELILEEEPGGVDALALSAAAETHDELALEELPLEVEVPDAAPEEAVASAEEAFAAPEPEPELQWQPEPRTSPAGEPPRPEPAPVEEPPAPAEPAPPVEPPAAPPPERLAPATAPRPEELAPASGDVDDDVAEVEFFVEQGLLDDARELLEELLARRPGHPVLEAMRQALAEAPAPGDPAAEAPLAPDPVSAPLAAAPARPAQHGESYLYSAEDVLGRFKEQVAQTVQPGDAGTHYDLGIAYKEMGLLGDAIEQFERALAAAGPARESEFLALIAVCRQELGDHGGAVRELERALRSEHLGADARIAIEYQLAGAYEAAGDRQAAVRHLERVVAGDPGYRDARTALARLGGTAAPAGRAGTTRP